MTGRLKALALVPLFWTWVHLTRLVARVDASPPPQVNLEGRKVVGLVRWYLDAMEAPRPTWSQLERWSNLDDPETARLRAEEVRRVAYYRDGGS